MASEKLYNKNNLSKRPFMLITTIYKPPRGARTEQKGWAERSGWDLHENVQFVDRITQKHLTNVTAIVDVLEAKLVKNGFADASPSDVMAHYLKRYEQETKQAIGIWMERQSHTRALADFMVEQEAKLNAATNGLEVTDVTESLVEELASQGLTTEASTDAGATTE